jgi:hypothetical protein
MIVDTVVAIVGAHSFEAALNNLLVILAYWLAVRLLLTHLSPL